MLGHSSAVRDPEQHVRLTPGVLVTDSRNVYDRLEKPYVTPKGAQKKIDIELLALKEAQNHTGLIIRWVHSDAQLANTLTKRGEEHQISRFISIGQQWRIIDDPNMFSGRRRRAKGMSPLENVGETPKNEPRVPSNVPCVEENTQRQEGMQVPKAPLEACCAPKPGTAAVFRP